MILMHKFLSQKSIDELVTALAMLAERRRSYYATIQLVRAARTGIDEPIIHPRASVTRLDGDMAEVTFFRADAPDDETPGTVNRWQYLDENGEPVNGKVIEVTLEHDPIGTVITFVCCDEEYLTEFRRLLANFGETLPELTERDPEAQTVTPTGDAPSDDAGKEVQAAAPTGDAPSDDAGRVSSAAPTGDARDKDVQRGEPPKPGTDGATWDDLFRWYYRNRTTCRTLGDLAKAAVFSPGHVRREHAKWKAQNM